MYQLGGGMGVSALNSGTYNGSWPLPISLHPFISPPGLYMVSKGTVLRQIETKVRHKPCENTFACMHGFTYVFNKHFVVMKDCHLISKMNLRKWTQERVKSSL